jgi:hypothetical protein
MRSLALCLHVYVGVDALQLLSLVYAPCLLQPHFGLLQSFQIVSKLCLSLYQLGQFSLPVATGVLL